MDANPHVEAGLGAECARSPRWSPVNFSTLHLTSFCSLKIWTAGSQVSESTLVHHNIA